jgi:hypothetical protein
MRSPFATLRWFALAWMLLAAWPAYRVVAAVQLQSPPNNVQSSPSPFGPPEDPNDPLARQRQEKMAMTRNIQRQQELVRDTDRLLALAKDLKEQVDKSSKNTLSIDVVKRAAEIEKLAKNVKDRMRE